MHTTARDALHLLVDTIDIHDVELVSSIVERFVGDKKVPSKEEIKYRHEVEGMLECK